MHRFIGSQQRPGWREGGFKLLRAAQDLGFRV